MSARLRRLAKVEEVENYGMEDGEWFVHLMPGWAFDDAVAKPEDDPTGAIPSHGSGGTVSDLIEAIREAQPCRCGRCVDLLGGST